MKNLRADYNLKTKELSIMWDANCDALSAAVSYMVSYDDLSFRFHFL